MPRGDGTGPIGIGRKTGRGAGYCVGFSVPGYENPVGFGCGLNGGCGSRRMFYTDDLPGWKRFRYPGYFGANEAVADERETLKNQVEFLENQLQQMKKKLSGLKEDPE